MAVNVRLEASKHRGFDGARLAERKGMRTGLDLDARLTT